MSNMKLSPEDRVHIIEYLNCGIPAKELAEKYDVNVCTIYAVKRDALNDLGYTKTNEAKVIQLYKLGYSYREIVYQCHSSYSTVWRIVHRNNLVNTREKKSKAKDK